MLQLKCLIPCVFSENNFTNQRKFNKFVDFILLKNRKSKFRTNDDCRVVICGNFIRFQCTKYKISNNVSFASFICVDKALAGEKMHKLLIVAFKFILNFWFSIQTNELRPQNLFF